MALRYLYGAEGRAEGRSFLRFITYVAVGGVALGVAALLLSLAIVRGFSQEIQNKIIGFGAHVQVRSYLQGTPLEEADRMQARLRDLPGVERAVPVVEDFILLRRSKSSIDGVVIFGTDEAPPYLRDRAIAGTFDLSTAGRAHPPLVAGAKLAERLDLNVGDRVTAFSMRSGDGDDALSLQRPRIKQFTVVGIYETSLTNIDDLYVFTGIQAARSLTGTPPNAVSHFDLTVRSTAEIDSVAAAVERQFSFPVGARTIYEQFSGLFAWVNLQESIIPLVIGVIVLVAAFNIIGTLLMLILEKTREIGVIQSLGASGRTVKRLFLLLGLAIGAMGTGIGSALALTLGLVQKKFEIIPLPAEAYYMKTAPIELNPLDFVVVAVLTLVLCALAAYVPARVAARIEPVRAIRFQ